MKERQTQATVLVVDDEPRNVKLLETLLRADGHRVVSAPNGSQALRMAAEAPPDLILLDVMMPEMDGFQVADALKQDDVLSNIPIIMVTALDDRESRLHALDSGCEEFLTKPVDAAELKVRTRNLLRLKEYGDFFADHNRILEEQVKERTDRLLRSYREAIVTLSRAAAYKDDETGSHVARVSFYCGEIAASLGMDSEFIDRIFYAAPMHDVGKMAIPDQILHKPSAFSAHEWTVMKQHTTLGAEMLIGDDSPYISMGCEIALSHHERWNGQGYPNGLKGEDIPLTARIMNICDQYDALRTERPYKPSFSHETAYRTITEGDGRTSPDHFDPVILETFKQNAKSLEEIHESHVDDVTHGSSARVGLRG